MCIGSLSERKNVLGLARAFAERGEGSLAFVGAGPLRSELEGRPGSAPRRAASRHDEVPLWFAAADVVCQPSLIEPFGLSTLEGMASARSVVATTVGGPPEFVPPEAGVLVTPGDDDELAAALETASQACRDRTSRPAKRPRHTT